MTQDRLKNTRSVLRAFIPLRERKNIITYSFFIFHGSCNISSERLKLFSFLEKEHVNFKLTAVNFIPSSSCFRCCFLDHLWLGVNCVYYKLKSCIYVRKAVLLISGREIFYTLKEAKTLIEKWRMEYNTFRPHSSLNYRPPAPEAYLN